MKINPAVDATLKELEAHEASATVDQTRRHVRIAWSTDDGRKGLLFTAKTPSDFRAAANARGVARRALRGGKNGGGQSCRAGVIEEPPAASASPPERMRQPPHPPRAKTRVSLKFDTLRILPPLKPWSPPPQVPQARRIEPPEAHVLRYLRKIKNEHCQAFNAVKVSSPRERLIDLAITTLGHFQVFTEREDRRLTKMIELLDGESGDRAIAAANVTWDEIVRTARRRVEEIDDARLWRFCEAIAKRIKEGPEEEQDDVTER